MHPASKELRVAIFKKRILNNRRWRKHLSKKGIIQNGKRKYS